MMHPSIQTNVPLAPYTSFGVGGMAEQLIEVHSTDELLSLLQTIESRELWLLGYGSNTLISDEGLKGLTVCLHGGDISVENTTITADAGVWWDDVVAESVKHNLWGLELMSYIPGSVGASLFINITAYGQSVGPRVLWVDVWNNQSKQVNRLTREDLQWDYKQSVFQQPENNQLIILRASFELSQTITDELVYQKAVTVAEELNLDVNDLASRRVIIHEARKRAGSLWDPNGPEHSRTAGSFFKNPIVSDEQLDFIISYEEESKTPEQIKLMNLVHGGQSGRVSAAHVMLAAGFKRGQSWGNVKLNEHNLLKIEALDGATAQDIYDVMRDIQQTVELKLGITLEPEARILGNFTE